MIGLAITVAFVSSWGASLGLLHHQLDFWWELALLIVIMLLGHWIEMRSLAQTTSALDSLSALLPDEAERVAGDGIQTVRAVGATASATSWSCDPAAASPPTARSSTAPRTSTSRW